MAELSPFDTLVLLTKSYPYDTGEEFLENEIDELSKGFDRVLIIATSVIDSSCFTRALPKNVSAYAIRTISNRTLKYFAFALRGLGSLLTEEVKTELGAARTVAAKIAVLYFAGRCHWLLGRLQEAKKHGEINMTLSNPIFYSYWFSDLPYLAVLMKRTIESTSIRLISRAHGYDLYEDRSIANSMPFRRLVFDNINKVYPCSRDGVKYLLEKYPEHESKIELAYLGTRDYGMQKHEDSYVKTVVTCSSVIPLKRLDLVLDALAELEKSDNLHCRWVCIGDGPLLPELKRKAKDKLQRTDVIFTGRLKNDEVLSYYLGSTTDLFINASEREGLPVSIMEAMSFGIPVLATNVGGTGEIVKDGVSGVLVNKDIDATELATEIALALRTDWDRRAVREHWHRHFDAKANYRDFVQKITS